MQIRLTVLGPLSGHTTCACDVLVTAPAGTALAAVSSGLAAAVAAAGSDLGSGAVVVHAGTERLDAQRCALGEPPLIDGAVLSLGAPADPERHAGVLPCGAPDAAARLHVVSGPDAGGVHLLHGGEVRVGRSSSADIPLDDPDVSRLHCAVTLADDGSVTLHDLGSTNGTTLEGEAVDGVRVPLPPGALLRVGESTLSLYGTGAPEPAALPAAPDGEGHLRVGTTAAAAPERAAGAATSNGTGLARFGGTTDTGAPATPGSVGRGSTSHAAGFAGLPGHTGPGRSESPTPPAGTPVPGPEGGPAEGGRRNRGIGAWARRLAGGRGAQRIPGDAAAEGLPPGADTDVQDATATTAAALRERWPDPAAVLLTALGPGPRLWERGPDHPDLLTVRLGTADRYDPDGSGPLPCVPVTVGLRQAGALGLAGPRARLSGLARSVLAQLAALHAPTTLEYVLISADRSRPVEERLAEWSWLGWLPQLRPAHGQDCRMLLAYDREQAEARVAELVRRLDDGPLGPHWATASPEAVATAAAGHRGPYTVLIVDGDPGSAALRETVARLAAGGPAAGVHLLCLAEAPATTPSSPVSATLATAEAASPAFPHCGAVALLSGDVATVVQVIRRPPAPVPLPAGNGQASRPAPAAPAGAAVIGALDAVSGAWAERFARALAPLRMADTAGDPAHASRIAAALPRTARLLDELGLARATPASLTARWAAATDRGARPGGRAVAVLGAGPHGPLTVDLAADGPHLLVEGGPGSGKTELLRSLAASLAAADRPDRLSLVLVDGAAAERGEGLRVCTDLPHVSTYLAAADPVRMREFAQALGSELKRRAELLGTLDFTGWHDRHPAPSPGPGVVAPRRSPEPLSADLEPSGTLKLRTQRDAPARTADTALPRLVVLVDDFDALVAPALGSTGRPAAGSVVRALEAVARDGERLGVHLIAASGRPERTADTAAVERAGLRAALEIAPPAPDAPAGADGSGGGGEPAPGRGRLQRPDDAAATPFQAGRVTGRIPRTATLRPTVVPLDWQRMGDPPTRRPLRELGNGPTDLALLASALQRAAQSAGAQAAPPLL
ncbi:FtsK/SpoIIIE domain-containing protein [Streptomyces sp. NPDC026206]|uniref:FtsK/SpoIIIE domain-containing protein n=1 Tax=Streptomyces sp. NPDC026206 TaxID=3157089 RepID=UPI0033CA7B5D